MTSRITLSVVLLCAFLLDGASARCTGNTYRHCFSSGIGGPVSFCSTYRCSDLDNNEGQCKNNTDYCTWVEDGNAKTTIPDSDSGANDGDIIFDLPDDLDLDDLDLLDGLLGADTGGRGSLSTSFWWWGRMVFDYQLRIIG